MDRIYTSKFHSCECLTVESKHRKDSLIGVIFCNACLRASHLHKVDRQALTFFSCFSHTLRLLHSPSPSEEISRSLRRAAIWAHLHAGLWMAWWTCSARPLNGQSDWECINIRPRGKEAGLIQRGEDRGREGDKYCECKKDWKCASAWWKENWLPEAQSKESVL